MRKTRLVILPTKCLHQMGFLLLFLSCPVIGDWGRIRPESENSHNAIRIDREGTCGFERGPPGGFVHSLNTKESQKCRLREDLDSNASENKPIELVQTGKSAERRDDFQSVSHYRPMRISERRMINGRDVRKTVQRRISDERREVRRIHQKSNVRSRSAEPRRSSPRNDVGMRSLSLSRLENNQVTRSIQLNNEGNLRREGDRLLLIRRMSERKNNRRAEHQMRSTREPSNERRENERIQAISERRERETMSFAQSVDSARKNVRRKTNKRSIQEQSMRRERTERRLSLAHRTQNDEIRVERTDNRRSIYQTDLKIRVPEIRRTRSLRFDGVKTARMVRSSDYSRGTDIRRYASLSPKLSERNIRHRVDLRSGKIEEMKFNRLTPQDISEVNLSPKTAEDNNLFGGITKWMDLKSYDNYKTGNWTTNCVIGAVVYYFTARQIKTL